MNAPRFPFTEFPTGWFAVARSEEMQPGDVRGIRYFGQDIALFRAEDGTPHATAAHCPHLGAYLPEGGRVVGDRLRCPFHGFEFDGRGRCRKNAYGTKAPPKARLQTWSVREIAGLVLLWHDAHGQAPKWQVDPLDMTGWTPVRMQTLSMRSHPQETSENSVDLGHFSELHGFTDPRVLEPFETQGPLLTAAYGVKLQIAKDMPVLRRALQLVGHSGPELALQFRVRVHGLGWSVAEGEIPALGARFRQFIMATPIERERMHLRIGTAVQQRVPGLDLVIRELIFRGLTAEVARDRPIWENKLYVEHPVLAKGDGPIPTYRKWCRQFYPTQVDAGQVRLPIAS